MGMKIPKKFMLFGTAVDIVFDNQYCENKKIYGDANYSKNKITLCDRDRLSNLCENRIAETFYHEKVHMILDAMNETDLSANEKFVDVFAKLLRQSDESAQF